MLAAWDGSFEREGHALVARICGGGAAFERDAAWRDLAGRIAPHVERWAAHSRLLRRLDLAGEDDVRAVLVRVLGRLADRDFHNLRAYLARAQPAVGDDAAEADAVEELARLTGDADGDGNEPGEQPLRGWLLVLVRFVAKDHAKARYGWSAQAPGRSKRDVITGAGELAETGERPPITDLIRLRRLVDDARALLATFDPPMARAFALWLEDHDFADIAGQLALPSPDAARALVRAAQARLRERLR